MHRRVHVARSFREIVHDQLDTERSEKVGLSATNWLLVFLILGSLVLYTAETEQEIPLARMEVFARIDLAILLIFGIEFLLRLYAAGSDPRYAGQGGARAYVRRNWFLVLVDFLAFAPELILILLGAGGPGALRALRVFRLFKMCRYIPAFSLVVDALKSCVQELLVAVSLLSFLWYTAAVILYLAEGSAQPLEFGSVTRSMWWSVVTLTTVGYGDVVPVTVPGKIAAGLIAVVGLSTVALPSGIIAGAFIDKFRERRRSPDGPPR